MVKEEKAPKFAKHRKTTSAKSVYNVDAHQLWVHENTKHSLDKTIIELN